VNVVSGAAAAMQEAAKSMFVAHKECITAPMPSQQEPWNR
jgi:hypothetical protein